MRNAHEHAQHMEHTRTPQPFHTYPNGGTVRSLAVGTICDLQRILQCIPEGSEVPPWVLMLISQAADSVHHVHNYITYYGSNQVK